MKPKKQASNNSMSSKSSSTSTLEGLERRAVSQRHSEHLQSDAVDFIAQEIPIALAYNGESHAVMMASPIDLRDFAIGFSISERIVDRSTDIRSIDIRQATQGITINIAIKPALMARLKGKRRQMSGRSGCGVCGITDLAAALPKIEPLSDSVVPSHTIIDQAVEALKNSQPLQHHCGAVHCAGLFTEHGELTALREDVGRHNALDKLIGNQINALPENCFVVMSSRASHELVAKVATCGINSLVTISAATSLAIDLAKEANLNLIGFVRDKRQIVYANSV